MRIEQLEVLLSGAHTGKSVVAAGSSDVETEDILDCFHIAYRDLRPPTQ
jgi:hypothetical protein